MNPTDRRNKIKNIPNNKMPLLKGPSPVNLKKALNPRITAISIRIKAMMLDICVTKINK